jgi:adenylosuccinate lyase
MKREDAYLVVQRNAMKVWDDIQHARSGPSYREALAADDECVLTAAQLDAIFDPHAFLKRADVVFERVWGLEF